MKSLSKLALYIVLDDIMYSYAAMADFYLISEDNHTYVCGAFIRSRLEYVMFSEYSMDRVGEQEKDTFRKLKGPLFFNTPASESSTMNGTSGEATNSFWPDHSMA
jgi:hypothetical protein